MKHRYGLLALTLPPLRAPSSLPLGEERGLSRVLSEDEGSRSGGMVRAVAGIIGFWRL